MFRQRRRQGTHTELEYLGDDPADAIQVLLPPINFIFKLLQQQLPVSVWLYEQLGIRIEGKIRVRNNVICWLAQV
jgi:hypothetical protein